MSQILCPWCGAIHRNENEPEENDGLDVECEYCCREFMINTEFSYNYRTVKIQPNHAKVQKRS